MRVALRQKSAQTLVFLVVLAVFLSLASDAVGAGAVNPGCGLWRQVPGEGYGGYRDTLLDVSALTTRDVWAVGGSLPFATTIRHWDGNRWRLVPSPNPGRDVNVLTSVRAAASNDVWAVGYAGTFGQERNLVVHWDGSVWQEIKAPSTGPQNFLYGVATDPIQRVWAVGSVYTSCSIYGTCHSTTFAMRWNGSAWTPTQTPSPSSGTNDLESVAVVSENDVWAVGSRSISSASGSIAQTLTLHWSGHSWEVVPSPNVGSFHNHLYHVAAVAANDVWAVGYQNGATLVMHWDGATWSTIPSPNAPSPFGLNVLTGLAVLGANDIYAVGWYIPGVSTVYWESYQAPVPESLAIVSSNESRPLILHWAGNGWSIVETPVISSPNSLYGVSVTRDPERAVFAVGTYYSGPDYAMLPLNLQFGPQCYSYLPIVAR